MTDTSRPSNSKPWSSCAEVPQKEMGIRGLDPMKWEFYRDVLLRLQQTKDGTAIRYLFADKTQARLYKHYVTQRVINTLGKGVLRASVRPNPTDTCYVYFARGPLYNTAPQTEAEEDR